MPRFAPFAGLRYDPSRVDLDAVIAPPYDVVEEDERAELARRHRANAVHVELPQPDPRTGVDRYAHAAELLGEWQADGVLTRDPEPALYAYRMTPPDDRSTTGVIGALGLDREGAGDVLPHEQTLPKPKSDRLDLLRATSANLSPIWGLSLTPGLTAAFTPSGPPELAATDDDGVHHELWVVRDPEAVAATCAAVERSPVVIADGHHRYETALAYRRELGAEDPGATDADLVMALVVELSPEELSVGPVHRVLSGLPDGLDLVDAFSSWFEVTRVGDLDERRVSALGATDSLALLLPSGAWLLSPRDGTPEAAGSDLDSSMVALVIAELPDHELEFRYSWQEALAAVASSTAQASVLLRPVSVDQIADWAHSGRRMPPKSTYFRPKPRTGMVYRILGR